MKQAVVIIHGIGEQRPMDTIRGLVNAILPERQGSRRPKFYNKPDKMNECFELRVLRSLHDDHEKRPTTDFFEFYWAHHMRDSQYGQVIFWIAKLLFRNPNKVSTSLKSIYLLHWIGVIVIIGLLIWGLCSTSDTDVVNFFQQKEVFVAGVFAAIQGLTSFVLLKYVADAARFLTPSPDNIGERNAIRAEGIALLQSLHKSKKYSRIIIVGHSLGSVIGYDIIRLLWEELRITEHPIHTENDIFERYLHEMKKIRENDKDTIGSRTDQLQQKQHQLWRKLRSPEIRIPWLITDFITLGSPMAHGTMLMADTADDFEIKKKECEYPTCPPHSSPEGLYYKKKLTSQNILSSGAPFSCTRWINLYFPHKKLIFGDIIGGPLRQVFGDGIKDVPVRICRYGQPSSLVDQIIAVISPTWFSHIYYWKPLPQNLFSRIVDNFLDPEHRDNLSHENASDASKAKERVSTKGKKTEADKKAIKDSLHCLKSALQLQSLYSKGEWPDP